MGDVCRVGWRKLLITRSLPLRERERERNDTDLCHMRNITVSVCLELSSYISRRMWYCEPVTENRMFPQDRTSKNTMPPSFNNNSEMKSIAYLLATEKAKRTDFREKKREQTA